MTKNFSTITGDISRSLGQLKKDIPDVLSGFSSLASAATKDGALSMKMKELIALALGVAAHCDGCIGFHTKKLAQLGASREELSEALGIAVYMGGGPSLMYAAEALEAYKQFETTTK